MYQLTDRPIHRWFSPVILKQPVRAMINVGSLQSVRSVWKGRRFTSERFVTKNIIPTNNLHKCYVTLMQR